MAKHYVRLHTRSKYKDRKVGQPQAEGRKPLPSKAIREMVELLKEKHPTAQEVSVKKNEGIRVVKRAVLYISFGHANQLGLIDGDKAKTLGVVEVRITAELEDFSGRICIQGSKVKGGKHGGLRWLSPKIVWQSPRCKVGTLKNKVTLLLKELENRDSDLSSEFRKSTSLTENKAP